MINRLWPVRIDFADFVLATKSGSNIALPLALSARSAQAFARERIKSLVGGWRGRRR